MKILSVTLLFFATVTLAGMGKQESENSELKKNKWWVYPTLIRSRVFEAGDQQNKKNLFQLWGDLTLQKASGENGPISVDDIVGSLKLSEASDQEGQSKDTGMFFSLEKALSFVGSLKRHERDRWVISKDVDRESDDFSCSQTVYVYYPKATSELFVFFNSMPNKELVQQLCHELFADQEFKKLKIIVASDNNKFPSWQLALPLPESHVIDKDECRDIFRRNGFTVYNDTHKIAAIMWPGKYRKYMKKG